MHLVFIKILFVCCLYDLCKGLKLSENRAEFFNKDGISNSGANERPTWDEDELAALLQEGPSAVVVELKSALLEKGKAMLVEEKETNSPTGTTVLATFDSRGLQDVSVYNDSFEIRQAIMALQPTVHEREGFSPTIHVLEELLQRDLPEGAILLMTMSRPSDEDFGQNLMRTLMGKKYKLSVLWAGNYLTDENLLLKNLTRRTGGKFGYVNHENNSNENFTEHYFPKSDFENLPEQIKFPEDENEIRGQEIPTVSRTANQKVLQKATVPLIVEVASGTSLEARPGTPTQIQFNVKNNINMPLPVVFNAKFNGIIQNVQPPQTLLQPSDTITVIVNLQPIGTAQSVNAVGTLTLLAVAANKVTPRSAIISMTPQTTTDNTAPKMYHKYNGDCSNFKEPQNCENGQWSLEATFQDDDSGLLKVLSEPYGLLFQSEFVAGTKSPVTVYYSATCCQPYTVIWAEDLRGNYVKKSFDVFNQYLQAGEIASIVLGVLLMLFILLAIIAIVIFIRRRNQRNMIIPRARSSSR